jgi:hypothetical protein
MGYVLEMCPGHYRVLLTSLAPRIRVPLLKGLPQNLVLGFSNVLGGRITANVGTEGATENFLIWTDFEFRDRIPFISLISSRIPMVYSSFCQNNSAAISDRARFAK